MLKISYTFKIPRQNLKLIKLSFLTLNLLWSSLSEMNKKQTNIHTSRTLKTLMLSPFHYKVAKKNITKEFYKFNVTFGVGVDVFTDNRLLVFKYPALFQVYFTTIGLTNIQFTGQSIDVKLYAVYKIILNGASMRYEYKNNIQISYIL